MSSKTIEIGDRARFIIHSYQEMLKSGSTLPHLLGEADPQCAEVMLGGEYRVLDLKENPAGISMCQLLFADADQSWVPASSLFLSRDVPTCPYAVGHKLLFRPKSQQTEVMAVSNGLPGYRLTDPKQTYLLRRIINSYYITVEIPHVQLADFPFKWEDFSG
jgi:hypothetical protein